MIQVFVDLSRASEVERAHFFAMPGVATAMDSLAHMGGESPVSLQLVQPDRDEEDRRHLS